MINISRGTAMQTLSRNVRSHMYPFAIGFTVVFIGAAYFGRVTKEEYATAESPNKRFVKAFIKKDAGNGHDSHGH